MKSNRRHDLTLFEYTDQEIKEARKMLSEHLAKWEKKPENRIKNLQLSRKLDSFLVLTRAHRRKKQNQTLQEHDETLQRKTTCCLEVFSRFDYSDSELSYIENRLNFLFESGKVTDDSSLDPFLLRQLLESEIYILKLNEKLRQAKTDIAIMRLQGVLSKESSRYTDIKQELGIKEPRETMSEKKQKEKQKRQDDEHSKYSDAISDIIKENQETKNKYINKIKLMKERKEARGE
jgi:hypothetical protein